MILSSGEAAIYEAASGIAVASLTDVNLCAQSERSEVFRFIFSELQQALPYLRMSIAPMVERMREESRNR